MISNNPKDYSSYDKWLAALKQDEAWLNVQHRLEQSTPADTSVYREDALRRIGHGYTFEYWGIHEHKVEKVVQERWSDLTLSKLKIQTIGMLMMEWLEQHEQVSGQNGNGIVLPKDLDTPKAREAFKKAMERKYMEASGGGKYHWIGTGKKTNNSELAYFLGKVYNCKPTIYGNKGMAFPEESLISLFGVKRLYSSLTQVYNAQKPQPWRSNIDDIFEQG